MRSPIRDVVPNMVPPSIELRDEALKLRGSQEAHDRFSADLPCLTTIEVADPPSLSPVSDALNISAWNIERCKRVEASADLIRKSGADIVLATEMDRGMARSGQRHTTADLARALGYGYAFGVEFVELGTGDARETAEFRGIPNDHGLHGNAILSRWPLKDVTLIPLDDGGYWYVQAPKNDGQYRIGGRMALSARIETRGGPLILVSVHLESESDAHGRATQIEKLLRSLEDLFDDANVVIGGDLNTKGFLEAGMSAEQILSDPINAEPCFSVFADYGFEWRNCNTGANTTRLPPWAEEDMPLKTLDWLFVRGAEASAPVIIPALSETGAYLSDHELIMTRVAP